MSYLSDGARLRIVHIHEHWLANVVIEHVRELVVAARNALGNIRGVRSGATNNTEKTTVDGRDKRRLLLGVVHKSCDA